MKKFLVSLWFCLWLTPAIANVSCSLPFNLQNGTTADASQVMANYNALVTCLKNAAAQGNNDDITALLGMTTPLAPASGGSNVFIGTSSGSNNAYVVTPTIPASGYSLTTGYETVFLPSFTNTATATLNVGGTGAINLYKQSSTGPIPLVAGDVQSTQLAVARYDGTQYEMVSLGGVAFLGTIDQTLSGGANVNASINGNLGSLSGGATTTIDCGKVPLQYFTNAGNQTLAAPTHDGSCDVLMINNASAGTISTSGFTEGANTGDAVDTTNGHKFIWHFEEIDGIATYFVKALQ